MKYTCACCGFKTLEQELPGTYDICSICFWEDDEIQFLNPDDKEGANYVSLREAQRNFIKFGACDEESINFVRRPNQKDIKDPNYVPLQQ